MSLSLPSGVPDSPADRLQTLPAWPWDPADPGAPRTLGFQAAAWCEGRSKLFGGLVQPNGPRAGLPFRLTGDQLRFLLWWYALDADGYWLFNHGVRRLAKGSGKSPFAAVLALVEFLAPVRLERFDDRVVGGCRGKPVDMPLVQIAATAESQTANTMRMVRAFAPKGSEIVSAYSLDIGKTRFYRVPEGTLEVITSSFTAAEGAEASFTIADESEHWKPANGGVDLASTLQDNLAKSGSRMLETSNAWVPGQESVAESTYDAWVAQEEGLMQGPSRILYDARMAPPDMDLADPAALKAGLEFVYADCDWKRPRPGAPVDVRPIMDRIWKKDARPDEMLRKYANRPTTAEDAWTSAEEWLTLSNPARVVTAKEPVVLFFDGSRSFDATAIVGCCVTDGHMFTVGVWEPTKNRVVDVQDVELTLAACFETHNVVGFFGDVKEWESFVKLSWPDAYKDRLKVMAVPGGKDPQWIAWDMRGHGFEFTQATELTEAEIRNRSFSHDGDSRLTRHVVNCRRRLNRYGVTVGKESPASPKKIDAAVCMIGARLVRRLVIAAGGDEPETFVPRRAR